MRCAPMRAVRCESYIKCHNRQWSEVVRTSFWAHHLERRQELVTRVVVVLFKISVVSLQHVDLRYLTSLFTKYSKNWAFQVTHKPKKNSYTNWHVAFVSPALLTFKLCVRPHFGWPHQSKHWVALVFMPTCSHFFAFRKQSIFWWECLQIWPTFIFYVVERSTTIIDVIIFQPLSHVMWGRHSNYVFSTLLSAVIAALTPFLLMDGSYKGKMNGLYKQSIHLFFHLPLLLYAKYSSF